jgi:hypothetical protein
MSRGLGPDKKPLSPLDSSSCPRWPKNYVAATGWYQTTMGYIFSTPPVTDKQPQGRLESHCNRSTGDATMSKQKKSTEHEERRPTAIYVMVNRQPLLSNPKYHVPLGLHEY